MQFITTFVTDFVQKFITKFGDSLNLSPNLVTSLVTNSSQKTLGLLPLMVTWSSMISSVILLKDIINENFGIKLTLCGVSDP